MSNLVLVSNTVATMTSLELVDFINSQRNEDESELRHDHFMVKVPKVLGNNAPNFLGTQKYGNNNARAIYIFPKREACLMAMSYSYDLQAKVFDHMTALEQELSKRSFNPATLSRLDILKLAIESEEQRIIAIHERDHAIATKAQIGSKREATAMAKASQAVKKAAKLEIELDRAKQYATVKRMQSLYPDQKFNWRELKRVSQELNLPPEDAFDVNYGQVKAYHSDVWAEAYGIESVPEAA